MFMRSSRSVHKTWLEHGRHAKLYRHSVHKLFNTHFTDFGSLGMEQIVNEIYPEYPLEVLKL